MVYDDIFVLGFVVFALIFGYFGAKKEAEVDKAYQERIKAESDARIAESKKVLMETIKEKILKKKEEIKELKIEFLKENVGNVFYFSDVEYQNNNLFNGEICRSISCHYVYVYEDDGEVLTKHILIKHNTKSNPSRYSNAINETVYDKVVSGIKNFDYLDKLIENGVILKELSEEIDYLINNVDNYNLSNCCAFVVRDDDSLKDRMKRIKYFIKEYVDSK